MYKYLGTASRAGEKDRKTERPEREKEGKLICGTTNNKNLDLCEFCLCTA